MAASSWERWAAIAPLLDAALDLAPERRAAFLAERCPTDPQLRREVERLLTAADQAGSFLADSALVVASPLVAWIVRQERFAPGDRLGAYQIEGEIGRGGMAMVYLARDTRHDRLVALKVLDRELSSTLGADRFVRETAIAARLNHPHVLPLFDSGLLDAGAGEPVLYYAMPYVDGRSLRQRLHKEPQLPIAAAVAIASQVAEALDHAHQRGIIHRDIKPENVLLSGEHAFVADFGIALALDAAGGERLTRTGLSLGTPAYMSPEQATTGRLDGRSDLYSLGCMLYEMLAGQPPFTGASAQAVLAQHAAGGVPPLRTLRSAVSAALERVIFRSLAKIPGDRFPTGRAFAEALAAAASTASTPADRAYSILIPFLYTVRRHRVLAAVLAAGVAVFAAVLGLRAHSSPATPAALDRAAVGTTARSNRLAVLPFENLGDSVDAHFTDGVTDAVRDKLAGLPGLEVIARSSSDLYRGTAKRPEQIGRELRVGHLLTGTIRWAKTPGRSIRVLVRPQLVDARTGTERWGEPFEAAKTDVFEVQAEVAARVAEVLGVTLGAGDRERLAERPTRNLAAYGLYLQGRTYWNQRTASALQNAAHYFGLAIGQDSSYAEAYAALAEAYELFPAYGAGPSNEALPKAKAAALRALSLDSMLSQPHLVLADQRAFYDWEWPDAERGYRRAIALKPSYATAHQWYSSYLATTGRLNEALVESERALTLDPLSRSISTDQGMILYKSRHYDESIAQLRRTLDLDPDFAVAHDFLGLAYLAKGEHKDGVAELETAARLAGRQWYLGDLAYAYAVSGRRAQALAVVRELAGRSRRGYVSPQDFAVAYTGLGNRDQAFAWLKRAADAREAVVTGLPTEPVFDSLRSDPRFTQLVKRAGLR